MMIDALLIASSHVAYCPMPYDWILYSEEFDMKSIEYKTSGTCSKVITFDLDDENRIHNLKFVGGCNGNLQGIGKLCEGMKADEIIDRVKGIKCGFKSTSCPDQLSKALAEAVQ